MTFADKLQKLRKAKRLSQEDLAERCGVTRQSVSKWETGLGYPETEKLLMLCDLLEVNLDYLLRDIKEKHNEENKQEEVSLYASYVGKWLQVFLKDREFNGFYCVALIAIQNTQLLFMDNKGKSILLDISSISTISDFCKKKRTEKLPTIPTCETITDFKNYFLNKKCAIKLKQEQALLAFNKPGGFYSVWVRSISDESIIVDDMANRKCIIKTTDVLFIKES